MTVKAAKHLIITGRVQGVGYRDAFCTLAQQHGVTGWVRNRRDGSVEAMVCGDDDALRAIIAWAHNGPALATVANVVVADADGTFDAFEFKSTA